jgi:hypothetical protein
LACRPLLQRFPQAKEGAAVMDALAEAVDLQIAKAAADWSEREIERIARDQPAECLPGWNDRGEHHAKD